MGVGIEASGAGVIPAQTHQPGLVKFRQEIQTDLPVQDAPHVVRILIEEGQQQNVQLGDLVGKLRQGHPGKIDSSEGHLLQNLRFGAVFSPGLDLDDHLAPGPLPDQLRKTLRAQDRGIALGLVFRIGQHIFRHRLLRHRSSSAANRLSNFLKGITSFIV